MVISLEVISTVTALLLTIMITAYPIQTSIIERISTNSSYLIEGHPLTIETDPAEGGAIVSHKFTSTNRTIHSQIYLGEQRIVDAVALDIVPVVTYLDEPTPTD